MRHAAAKQAIDIHVDSAGTGGWHIGDPPDKRMSAAASKRGIDLSGQRARQVCEDDFRAFTHIFAMDTQNLSDLRDVMPADATADLQLFLGREDVPDPYYGGVDGFEHVLDLVQRRVQRLLVEMA